MRTFVKYSLYLVVLITPAHVFAQEEAQLSVISFGSSRYVMALNAEPQYASGRPTRQQQIDDRERQTLERGYGDLLRARELRRVEHAAARSSVKPSDLFVYRLKVRNNNEKTVKNVYWEYQIIDSANPNSAARRQFFCDQKIRTNNSATFKALSPVPPKARTISAKTGGAAKAAFEEKAVVNRIEYTDNSIWQREGWDFPNPAAAALSTYKRVRGEPPCTTF